MLQQLKWLPFDKTVNLSRLVLSIKQLMVMRLNLIYRLCLLILETNQIIPSDLQLIKNDSFLEHINETFTKFKKNIY